MLGGVEEVQENPSGCSFYQPIFQPDISEHKSENLPREAISAIHVNMGWIGHLAHMQPARNACKHDIYRVCNKYIERKNRY